MKLSAAVLGGVICLTAGVAQAQTPTPAPKPPPPVAVAAPVQDVIMRSLDFDVAREIMDELDFTVIDEDVDEDGDHYIEVETDSGLTFNLYGNVCDADDASRGCMGANLVTTFSMKPGVDLYKLIDEISFAFMKVYRTDEDIRISRFIVFDGGLTRANLAATIDYFSDVGDMIWQDLVDADALTD